MLCRNRFARLVAFSIMSMLGMCFVYRLSKTGLSETLARRKSYFEGPGVFGFMKLPTTTENQIPQPSTVDVAGFLKTELGQNSTEVQNFVCRQTSISTVKFPICLYTAGQDKWVSGAFLANGYWEGDQVKRMIRAFQKISPYYNNSVGFIDIGANLGTYSLPLAHLGYSVLAIEPNRATLTRLASSIYRGNVTEKVTLLKIGVSDKRETFQLGADVTNRGNTYLSNCTFNPNVDLIRPSDAEVSKNRFATIPKCLNESISTVLLDDITYLLPHKTMIMKIDIQCSEIKSLSPISSTTFFKINYVPLILMEWECYQPQTFVDEPRQTRIRDFISYFISMNYTAHSVQNGNRMSKEEWLIYRGIDVVLIKNDVPIDKLWT